MKQKQNIFLLAFFLLASSKAFLAENNYGKWGVDLSGMDLDVCPGDDFGGYVNGNWSKNTEIPADKSIYGTFIILRDLSEKNVKEIIEEWASNLFLLPESDEGKVAAIYRMFMDEENLEALDDEPLVEYLDSLKPIATKEEFAFFMGKTLFNFGKSFFNAYVQQDKKDISRNVVYFSQSGLGLPDRDYYLQEQNRSKKEKYLAYVEKVLKSIDWKTPYESAFLIVELEEKIAQAHWSKAESRDEDKTYNPTTIQKFMENSPNFPWARFFEGAKLNQIEGLVVEQDTAIAKLAKLYNETSLETLKAWQAFSLASQMSPYLSKRFSLEHWKFYSNYLNGVKEEKPRWKRAVSFCESLMGEAIGKEYVNRHFNEDSKNKMLSIVQNLLKAMGGRINSNTWMSDETKIKALQKLNNFKVKIGYPSKWKDYSLFDVVNNNLVKTLTNSREFEWNILVAKLSSPVDPEEWFMTPQTVNAYFNPPLNEIVFPAAILQPPFFNPNADMAVNYGAIGAVIGHEITHGFDDQGRKYNQYGALEDWWHESDENEFNLRAKKLGEFYGAIVFPNLPDVRINPELTMGENIADLGGILVALNAYRNAQEGKFEGDLDGFTQEQRFFLGFAQVWRTKCTEEYLKNLVTTDPHSPGRIRAYAPLCHIDAWYSAFGVEPIDKNYLTEDQRVKIW